MGENILGYEGLMIEDNLDRINEILDQCILDSQKIITGECVSACTTDFINHEKEFLGDDTYEKVFDAEHNTMHLKKRKKTEEEKLKENKELEDKVSRYKQMEKSLNESFQIIAGQMQDKFGKNALEEMYKIDTLSVYLDIIEYNKYNKICVNDKKVLYCSLFNGFSFEPYNEIINRLYENYIDEVGEFFVFNCDVREKYKDKINYTIGNGNKSDYNKSKIEIEIKRPGDTIYEKGDAVIKYNSVLRTSIRDKIKPYIDESINVHINEFDGERELRRTRGRRDSKNINVFDVLPYLSVFMFICEEYDVNHYPNRTCKLPIKPFSNYSDEDEIKAFHEAYGVDRYVDLIEKSYDLYVSLDDAGIKLDTKIAVLTQLWRLNEIFGINKTIKLKEHFEFWTSNDIIEKLHFIFPCLSEDGIRHIIENYVFKDEVFLRGIYQSPLMDPFMYFEYIFLYKIYVYINSPERTMWNDRFFKKIIIETLDIINRCIRKITLPESVKKKLYYKDSKYYNYIVSFNIPGNITLKNRDRNKDTINVKETESNIYEKMCGDNSSVTYYEWDYDYDKLTDFLKNHCIYNVIEECIREYIERTDTGSK